MNVLTYTQANVIMIVNIHLNVKYLQFPHHRERSAFITMQFKSHKKATNEDAYGLKSFLKEIKGPS